eukprot:Anaeramoba_flamelloidesa101495_11.p2 GENE.a101495_11~~a101495_11.p2  ORF type:complete len:103 (-),score=0.81 a101495_11:55-363(-)
MTGLGQAMEIKFCHPGIHRILMGKVVHGGLPLVHNLIMAAATGFRVNELVQIKGLFFRIGVNRRGLTAKNQHQYKTQANQSADGDSRLNPYFCFTHDSAILF